jgi:hypothetical protein
MHLKANGVLQNDPGNSVFSDSSFPYTCRVLGGRNDEGSGPVDPAEAHHGSQWALLQFEQPVTCPKVVFSTCRVYPKP